MKILLLFLTTLFLQTTIHAECLACWTLIKVNISLTHGKTLSGYVKWNDASSTWDKNSTDSAMTFPQNMLYSYRNIKSNFILYKKITEIKNDSITGFFGTTSADTIGIDPSFISDITEIQTDSAFYEGAGSVMMFSEGDLKKLKNNPFAVYMIEGIVSDIYLISYNPEITHKDLNHLKFENYNNSKIKELQSKGVIVLEISFD